MSLAFGPSAKRAGRASPPAFDPDSWLAFARVIWLAIGSVAAAAAGLAAGLWYLIQS